MRECASRGAVFTSFALRFCIISPIIFFACGCSSDKNNINGLSRRDYLPEFYSSSFVLGGSASDSPELFIRENWPNSPEATRAVTSANKRVYERSSYYWGNSSNGRPHDNFSYRIVTTDVK